MHRGIEESIQEWSRDEAVRIDWAGEEALVRAAHWVYEWRRQRGITQTDLAEKAGTGQPNISALENGDANPTLRTLGRISAALRCDLIELLRPIDSPEHVQERSWDVAWSPSENTFSLFDAGFDKSMRDAERREMYGGNFQGLEARELKKTEYSSQSVELVA